MNNGLHHQPEYSKGIFHDYFFVSRVNYSAMNKATMPITREIKMPVLNNISSSGHFISL
ncbi:hypothetical protein LNQ52_15070 [Klebsiella pneumoniae subsp. pneumoniae]|nr:hypothetical protein [Klebsiella pneumoniae subsp. pneumoniae]